MKLLVIILALLALRYLHVGRSESRYHRVLGRSVAWLEWLHSKGLRSSNFLLFALILPPLLIVYGVELLTYHQHSYTGSVVWFLVTLFLFWFTLWPVPVQQLETEGFDVTPEEIKEEAAEEAVKIDPQGELLSVHNSHEASRNKSKKILIEANQNTFAVIWWFVLLGVYGAIIYRLINLLYRHASVFEKRPEWAFFLIQLQQVIDWIPARLVALSYVLAGNFVPGFQKWRHYATRDLSANDALLTETGLAAAGYKSEDVSTADDEENRSLCRLTDRTLIVWLFLIAILVLGRLMY